MIFVYAGLFFLSFSLDIWSAASSSSSASSSDDDVQIAVASGSLAHSVGGSRLHSSRGFSALNLNLVSATPDHYDIAQQHIENIMNQVSLATPRTGRSKHALLEHIGIELTRQKNVLAESIPMDSSPSFESAASSSSSQLSNEEMQHIITSQRIANELLTQMLVRQQDDREHDRELVKVANFWARIELVAAVLGTVLGFAGTAIAIVPLVIH